MGTKNTEVALSYKSVDYLSFGLPLINSAKHETMRLRTQDAGFNFDDNQIGVLVNKLSKISYEDIIKMKAAYKVFQIILPMIHILMKWMRFYQNLFENTPFNLNIFNR